MGKNPKKKRQEKEVVRNPVVQRAFKRWLCDTEDFAERLAQAEIKEGYILSLASEDHYPDEKVIWWMVHKIEEVTGLDMKGLLFAGAKENLWLGDDPLPEISDHQAMLKRLDHHYRTYGAGKLASLTRCSEGRVIREWMDKGTYVTTRMLQNALLAILFLDHPEEFAKRYPDVVAERVKKEPAKPKEKQQKKGMVSDGAVRAAINMLFGTLTTGMNLVEQLLRETDYQPLEGDQLTVMRHAARLLKVFGVDAEAVANLAEERQLTPQQAKQLQAVFGGKS